MKKIILIFFICFLFSLVYGQDMRFAEERWEKEIKKIDSIHLSKYGTDYPAFIAITLNGDTITEKQLIGKVTLINFWFESCEPCMAEIPALNELYLKYKDHPEFCLLSFTRDYPEDAQEIVRKLNIPYPVCPISNKESYRLNLNSGFPTTIIIDAQGKIRWIKSGGPIEKEKVKEAVLELEKKIVNLFAK